MDTSSQTVNSRAEQVKKWLKSPYHLGLLLIIVFAFAVRLYYFFVMQGHPLWWDEAEYMATAKRWAFGIPFDVGPFRPPLFMFLAMFAFLAGFGENFVQFWLVLLPSVALVAAVYYLGKEMFNEKTAIVGAFLTAVSWTLLFWTSRIQPDFFSMLFQVLGIIFMWKHWKSPSAKFVVLAGVFSALGFHFKVSGLLVPLILGIFSFIKDRFAIFKDKHYYYFIAAFVLTLVPYFLWSYASFGSLTPIAVEYSDDVASNSPFGWYNLKFFYTLTGGILFLLFIFGTIMSLQFLLYGDLLIKERQRCFDPHLFSVLSLIVISAFYIFWVRGTEDRWVFLWLPFIFYLIGNASLFFYEHIKRYQKIIAFVLVFGLLVYGAYAQLQQADQLIKGKRDSYGPVKEAALWIKENSNSEDRVSTLAYTQTVYYSERNVTNYAHIRNETAFLEYLKQERPRYVIYSVFESFIFDQRMKWFLTHLQSNPPELRPVQAYFADANKQQPLLIVYEVDYGKIN